MITVDEIPRSRYRSQFPGKWTPIGEQFATRIELPDVGILVIHSQHSVHFAAGVAQGLNFSPDLVRHAAK